MSETKHWVVDVYIEPENDERDTCAYVRLNREHPELFPFAANGWAQRTPSDKPADTIGAELAVARALTTLGKELERDAVLQDRRRGGGNP